MCISCRLSIIVIVIMLCSGICACAMPRIIEIKDPLSAQEHNDLGVAYEQKGDFELARKEYRAAAQKRPDWALPHFNLGNLFAGAGDAGKAEASYRKAWALEQGNPDIMNNLSFVLYQQGKVPEAKALIQKAWGISPKPAYRDTCDKIFSQAGACAE